MPETKTEPKKAEKAAEPEKLSRAETTLRIEEALRLLQQAGGSGLAVEKLTELLIKLK